jgi:hypothetical protein
MRYLDCRGATEAVRPSLGLAHILWFASYCELWRPRPYKVCPVKKRKKKGKKASLSLSLQCLNITRERVSADFFEPHRSNLPSHTKDFFSFSLFSFSFLLVCFGILFPSVFRGRFYPGSHFASSSSSPFEPMRCVCPPFRVCVYLRDRPSSVPLLPLLLGRSL